MAGGAFFDITVTGVGAHGGRPESGIDPIVVAAQIVSAAQSIVARNIAPLEPAVLSITTINGGNAYNVIPNEVTLCGTARGLHPGTLPKLETLFRRTIEGVAASLGATAKLDWRVIFNPLVNDPIHTTAMADAAAELVGEDKVERNAKPMLGSEDFSFMMEKVGGAYINLGIGKGADLHNPSYAFNDEAIPYGSAMMARLVERGMPA